MDRDQTYSWACCQGPGSFQASLPRYSCPQRVTLTPSRSAIRRINLPAGAGRDTKPASSQTQDHRTLEVQRSSLRFPADLLTGDGGETMANDSEAGTSPSVDELTARPKAVY